MRKWSKRKYDLIQEVEILKDSFDIINDLVPREPQIVKNDEISINYVRNKIIQKRNKVKIDEAFAYNIVINVMITIEDCRQGNH